ncbi:MAG: PHB depolymerase family esterase [Chloracidobacterium sp.]|uniref:Alpha/beta fold hydrolase n=1 Tax=Chloracidobacterium validum TaxID=2821543 RepID=A0ABX8B803_9BACT|nr:PHB depolymerase family esterase [Chloracidobacterium validum]QUW02791.1 alpha/beta fold hydrolase [Chloracidobacterium validum]
MRARLHLLALWLGLFGLVGVWVSVTQARRESLPTGRPHTLHHGGIKRTYHLHVPECAAAPPWPVVIALHGGGGASAEEMERRFGFARLGNREGFLTVYPAGVNGQWNDGRGKTFRRAQDNTDVDDVGFIRTLIEHLVKTGQADPDRVYVTGFSNGGMMTYRLGIELGDRLAAIAAGIANLPTNLRNRTPVRALPVLIMNGTDDPMVPWQGGDVRVLGRAYGTVLSTQETVDFWRAAARLPTQPTVERLPDRVPSDQCQVEVRRWTERAAAPEVVLYAILGGGHQIPGGATPKAPRLVGKQCMDIQATEVIWTFFAQHRRSR